MVGEAALIGSIARLAHPLVRDIYQGAKRIGINGLQKWDATTFPRKIANRLRSIEMVKTLWKADDAISITEFFHPPKLLIDDKPQRISRLSDLPSNAIVIEGIVGQGKSIYMRSLAVEEISSNDAKRLPVFLELKTLTAKTDLRLAIFKQLEGYDIQVDEDTLSYLFKTGKITLLLDGFDEIEEALVKETYISIENLTSQYPDLQIIISSRPGREIQKSPTFKILRIAPLIYPEYAAFLERLKVGSEKSLAIRQAIKNSPSNINNLITTPLMLTLVVLVYQAESQIPETLPEFFHGLFQVVFSRHDHLKAAFSRKHYSGLSEPRLLQLFETFCFMTIHEGHSTSLTLSEFNEIFLSSEDYAENCKCEPENFKKDITKVACLMLDDGFDSISFLHKSILEYYAAAFIKRLGEENAKLFYTAAINENKEWEDVLIFLRSIDGVRYARYYVAPLINNYREKIIIPSPNINDGELIGIVEATYGCTHALLFKVDDKSDILRVVAVTHSGDTPRDHIGNFENLLYNAIVDTAPQTLTTNEAMQFLLAEPIDRSGKNLAYQVKISNLISRFGANEVRKAIGILEQRLKLAEESANAVMATEEKKKSIFAPRRI